MGSNDREIETYDDTDDQRRSSVPAGAVAVGIAAAALGGLALFSKLTANRIERDIPADGKFITVDGTRLHYRDAGESRPGAPAIVMIHGLGGQMRNFSYALLDELAGEHRVILVDRPGSGYSAPVAASRANVRAQAALIAKFVDAIGLDRPLVVGHSLGGAVALAMALDHPATVGGLALIAPLAQPVAQLPDAFKGLAVASVPLRRALSWTLATPIGLLTRDKALKSVFAPEPVPEDFGTLGGGRLVLRPGAFQAASGDMMAANNDLAGMAARYGELTMLVGILYGREDRILDPALHGGTTAGQVPGLVLDIIEGGHMIPVTRPAETARWIKSRAAAMSAQA